MEFKVCRDTGWILIEHLHEQWFVDIGADSRTITLKTRSRRKGQLRPLKPRELNDCINQYGELWSMGWPMEGAARYYRLSDVVNAIRARSWTLVDPICRRKVTPEMRREYGDWDSVVAMRIRKLREWDVLEDREALEGPTWDAEQMKGFKRGPYLVARRKP